MPPVGRRAVQGGVCALESGDLLVVKRTFDELSLMLIRLERQHQRSSIAIFRDYLSGKVDADTDESLSEWVSLILLYLGTPEVREWACPIAHRVGPRRKFLPADPDLSDLR